MSINWDAELLSPVMGLFGEGVPGDDATLPLYTPRGGTGFRLADAVFDQQYERVSTLSDGNQISARTPVLGVRVSLFARPPAQNDVVFVPSVNTTFLVSDVEPDGHGHAKLILMVKK